MSHVILPKQNKQGMDIITKESLCRLLGINPSRIKESSTDSDFIKELKQRITFGQTKDVKAAAPAGPSLFAPHYLGTGVPPLYQPPASNKEAEAGSFLDRLFSINQRYGGKN